MSPHMLSHGCILQPVSHTAAGARCLWVFQERVDALAAFNTLKPGSRSKGVGRAFFSGGGMRWGGQSASCFVLCLRCFGAAAELPWRGRSAAQRAFISGWTCLTRRVFRRIKDASIDANHTGPGARRRQDFGHAVEMNHVTAHTWPLYGFYGIR